MEEKIDRILENQKIIMEALYQNGNTSNEIKGRIINALNKKIN